MNGGRQFTFSPAVSLVGNCDTQAEVDDCWHHLSAGGEPHNCGSLKDRCGVSWKIVPPALLRLVGDADGGPSAHVMQATIEAA